MLTAAVASCQPNVVAPSCVGTIDLELSSEQIFVGDTFEATAMHRVVQCLVNLNWTTTGPISLAEAQGTSATFTADDAGTGTITVRNPQGDIGVISVDVQQGEELSAPDRRTPQPLQRITTLPPQLQAVGATR